MFDKSEGLYPIKVIQGQGHHFSLVLWNLREGIVKGFFQNKGTSTSICFHKNDLLIYCRGKTQF